MHSPLRSSNGKMKFLSESIPASSEVFWNRFRIVGPESVSGIDSGIGSRIRSGIDSGIGSGIGIGSAIEIGSVIGIGTEIIIGFETESVSASL